MARFTARSSIDKKRDDALTPADAAIALASPMFRFAFRIAASGGWDDADASGDGRHG